MNVDRIKKALTAACAADRDEVFKGSLDVGASKIVVLSDLHRGARNGDDDDFWRCEQSYNAALGYYLMSGYTLVLLGDVEELWENSPKDLAGRYPQTFGLEREFYKEGRLLRTFGNHDDLWASAAPVRDYFDPDFAGLVVYEALRYVVKDGATTLGELVLTHGHQGSGVTNTTKVGQFFVRHFWRRLQRKFHVSANTPAQDHSLRGAHASAMRDWAITQEGAGGVPVILIAGHTHQPVFGTSKPAKPDRRELAVVKQEYEQSLGAGDPEATAKLRAELEMVKTEPFGTAPVEMPIPCYFNTGCCCFFDGDVTGLELADREIRLVRWLDDERKPLRKVLVRDELAAVFGAIAAGEPRPTPPMTEPVPPA